MNSHLLVVAGMTVIGVLLLRLFRRDSPRPTSVEPWVIEAFREKKRKQWLLGIPTGLVFVFIYWNRAHPSGAELVLMPVAFVVIAWVCIFSYRNWRCPKCGAYLGKYAWQAGVCPKCGTALREPREAQGNDRS